MKFTGTTILFVLQAAQAVFASPASIPAQLEAECGALHVLKYNETELPQNVDHNNIRHCLNHPSGSAAKAQAAETLDKRTCVSTGQQFGCGRGGYCWKVCAGAGAWCWQAANAGWGDWIRCSADVQCIPNPAWGCGQGGCDGCGCDCTGGLPW